MDTSLDRVIHSRAHDLTLTQVVQIACQLAHALSYLHPSVIHRCVLAEGVGER